MPMARENGGALRAELRVEQFAVDGVVDDVELRFGDAEAVADLVLHHSRVADHGLQPRAREEPPLHRPHVAVVRRQREAQPGEPRRALPALLLPHRMDAVARAVDVAAEETFVRFDQVGLGARDRAARRPREAPFAQQAARVPRVADDRLDQLELGLRPRPRVERDRDVALEQRLERALEEPFRAYGGRVTLADDREPHGSRWGRVATARARRRGEGRPER